MFFVCLNVRAKLDLAVFFVVYIGADDERSGTEGAGDSLFGGKAFSQNTLWLTISMIMRACIFWNGSVL